jgi:hypothetical protein
VQQRLKLAQQLVDRSGGPAVSCNEGSSHSASGSGCSGTRLTSVMPSQATPLLSKTHAAAVRRQSAERHSHLCVRRDTSVAPRPTQPTRAG